MFQVVAKRCVSEDGVIYIGYGIQGEKCTVEDVTLCRKEAEQLANICNRLQLPEEELFTVAQDFVQK